MAIVVASAIVLVVLLAALFSGIVPGWGGSRTGSTCCAPPVFSEKLAAALGDSFASGATGGPWTLYAAEGVVSWESTTVNGSSWATDGCPLTGGTATAVDVPADLSTYSSGAAEGWYLFYHSPGTGRGADLFLFVLGSTVYNFGEIECGTVIEPFTLSPDLIDSTTAASAAGDTAAGTNYIAANPHANASYLLAETGFGASWTIEFNACTAGVSEGFAAVVYALNGTVYSATNEPGGTC